MEEIWNPILGYEGLYEISNYGRAKSYQGLKPKMLALSTNVVYQIIRPIKDGVYATKTIHRLVAIAFIPNPENKPFVNHLDGNKHNNHVLNLEWSTVSENSTHAVRAGLRKSAEQIKKKPIRCKRILNQVTGEIYIGCQEAAKSLFVSKATIERWVNGSPFNRYNLKYL